MIAGQMREVDRIAVEEFGLDMLRGTREEIAVLGSHIDLGGDRKDTFDESKTAK